VKRDRAGHPGAESEGLGESRNRIVGQHPRAKPAEPAEPAMFRSRASLIGLLVPYKLPIHVCSPLKNSLG
jgi:hypothetical protein